jgi:hypothetical protein
MTSTLLLWLLEMHSVIANLRKELIIVQNLYIRYFESETTLRFCIAYAFQTAVKSILVNPKNVTLLRLTNMPAITRTHTGEIKRKDYSLTGLRLVGECPAVKPPRAPKISAEVRRKVVKGTDPKVTRVRSGKEFNFDSEGFKDAFDKQYENFSKTPVDVCEGVDFVPNVCFGERTEGMSAIAHADHEIEKWEKVKQAHQDNLPGAVPSIMKMIKKLKEARAQMEENEENTCIV